MDFVLWFNEISKKDIGLVGGKNGSLGEMYSQLSAQNVNIPYGFALTTKAYWDFIEKNNFKEKLAEIFSEFDPQDFKSLQKTGKRARGLIMSGDFSEETKKEIFTAYKKLSEKYGTGDVDVAVRSSAVCEDSPDASFAGQFETYLNITGKEALLDAIKECYASSFGDRVIAYREEKGFAHLTFALSVCIQKMVRSDLASAGIMFTVDTETGFENVVLINSVYGLGEMVVQGSVTPDEFYVYKPTFTHKKSAKKSFDAIIIKNLGSKNKKYVYGRKGGIEEESVERVDALKFSITDKEVLLLAKWGCIIEDYYGAPQDIEWAKDGQTGELFIVQSRPETIYAGVKRGIYKEYNIKTDKVPILTGIAVGEKVGKGKVQIIEDVSDITNFKKGNVLVTRMTDPNWVPIMRMASAIVTNEGGRTCHAAIVSRELGVPSIVGSKIGTKVLKNNQFVTVDCTQGGTGRIFDSDIPYEVKEYNLEGVAKPKTKITMNVGAPEVAFKSSFLPNDGIGLARQEFIVADKIQIHPMALYYYDELEKFSEDRNKIKEVKDRIDELTAEHGADKKKYFVYELAEGIAQIAASVYPKQVILRLSDFKTNEYRDLIGGEFFEKSEENPMMGFRGASRYLDDSFKPAFKMECEAIKRVREEFGLTNLAVMVPFCRTIEEAKAVVKLMAEYGLKKGEDGLQIIVMAEIPANVILADEFLDIFDGMSIGSNDLAQLTLGLDRDNVHIAHIGNEFNPAVMEMIRMVIKACKKRGKYCGICGEAASNQEFAKFLVAEGIEALSVNPDSVIKTTLTIAEVESKNNK